MNAPHVSPIHPWNEAKANSFQRDRQHLSHALLFAGPKGLGKNALATWLAQLLLCANPSTQGSPCGLCQGCRLFAAGSHPDLHVLQPEANYKSSDSLIAKYALRYAPADKSKESKDSTVIRIDQVRSLIEAAQTRPQIAACKVLILSPADSMNVNAANSLLKLLEEPPADSYLLLIADRPARLPATIRSRCVRMELRSPPAESSLTWLHTQNLENGDAKLLLELAAGAPLAALELGKTDFLGQRITILDDLEHLTGEQGDPLACATRWKALGAERCLLWLQGWLSDQILIAVHPDAESLHNSDLRPHLQALEKRLDLKQLFGFADRVAQGRSLLGGPLDEQLMLEDLLISWTALHRL
jgi:DNA polymerase III subunit delta'